MPTPLRAFIASFAVLATTAACVGEESPLGPSDPTLDADEAALVVRINQLRTENGKLAVAACGALDASAASASDDARDRINDLPSARDRLCADGFEPACGNAHIVLIGASLPPGADEADRVIGLVADGKRAELLDDKVGMLGVGRSPTSDRNYWTILMVGLAGDASAVHPSCQ